MPSKTGQKRTIKLRQANQHGQEYIRVGGGQSFEYPQPPTFTITIQINPQWFTENIEWLSNNIPQTIGGEASLAELYQAQQDFWLQQVTLADFTEFMFHDTIFDSNFWETW